MNRNAQKGYRLERDCMIYLGNKGYLCMRAYASKGKRKTDILAIPPTNNKGIFHQPLIIQCKSNNYVPPAEREILKENDERYQGWVVICYRDRGVKFRSLSGEKIMTI